MFDVGKTGKVTVAVNYRNRGEPVNSIRSVGWLKAGDIVPGKRYIPLDVK